MVVEKQSSSVFNTAIIIIIIINKTETHHNFDLFGSRDVIDHVTA